MNWNGTELTLALFFIAKNGFVSFYDSVRSFESLDLISFRLRFALLFFCFVLFRFVLLSLCRVAFLLREFFVAAQSRSRTYIHICLIWAESKFKFIAKYALSRLAWWSMRSIREGVLLLWNPTRGATGLDCVCVCHIFNNFTHIQNSLWLWLLENGNNNNQFSSLV